MEIVKGLAITAYKSDRQICSPAIYKNIALRYAIQSNQAEILKSLMNIKHQGFHLFSILEFAKMPVELFYDADINIIKIVFSNESIIRKFKRHRLEQLALYSIFHKKDDVVKYLLGLETSSGTKYIDRVSLSIKIQILYSENGQTSHNRMIL